MEPSTKQVKLLLSESLQVLGSFLYTSVPFSPEKFYSFTCSFQMHFSLTSGVSDPVCAFIHFTNVYSMGHTWQVLCRGWGHGCENHSLCLRGTRGLVGKIGGQTVVVRAATRGVVGCGQRGPGHEPEVLDGQQSRHSSWGGSSMGCTANVLRSWPG